MPGSSLHADNHFRPERILEEPAASRSCCTPSGPSSIVTDFLEVETPILSADTVVDRHLDPFAVIVADPAGSGGQRSFWLQTSPEFAMKRLLASGGTAIYQIARVFRQDERGPLHNPEFTMVEWYRVGDMPAEGMRLLSDLGEAILGRGPAERVTYAEAFQRFLGIDPHGAEDAGAGRRRSIQPGCIAREPCGGRSRRLARSTLDGVRPTALGNRPAGDSVRLSRQPGRVGPCSQRAAGSGGTL